MFLKLSLAAFIFFAVPATVDSEDKKDTESRDWSSPEIIVAIVIPLVGAVAYWIKESISNTQKLGRQRFKDEINQALQVTLKEEIAELSEARSELLSIKLAPIQQTLEQLAEELKERKLSDRQIEQSVQELKHSLSDVKSRMAVVESTIRHIGEKLNVELSAILTAYIGDPIRVSLFKNDDD